MRSRASLRFLLLPVTCVFLCSANARAQLPRSLERCLPYPTLAEEIEDIREDVSAKMNQDASSLGPEPRGSIEAIKFDAPIHLPARILDRLIAELKQHEFGSGSEWLDEIQEVPIKGAWENYGYYKVKTTPESQMIDGDSAHLYFSVTVHVDEGLQYRLRDVSFRSVDPDMPLAFPPEHLRGLILLHDGDIFSADQIRNSLEALKKFYDGYGYVDFAATPFMDVDDSTKTISLRMELDQQKQFRTGTIDMSRLDQNLVFLLGSKMKSGDLFNEKAIKTFLDEHKSELPPLVSHEEIILRRDIRKGTVDVRFGFRLCPDE